MTVPAVHCWRSNAELIVDVAKLGYLQREWLTLDPTYGEAGGFWKTWRPEQLVAHDIKLDGTDFRALPYSDGKFDAVVFDPPYKLSGTPASADFDTRFGVDTYQRWQDRIQLMVDGLAECTRVLKRSGFLLAKCMDQVCSGQMRWQTVILTNRAAEIGLRLVDRFDLIGKARPQPPGRRQVHARGRGSTLLIFSKEGTMTPRRVRLTGDLYHRVKETANDA